MLFLDEKNRVPANDALAEAPQPGGLTLTRLVAILYHGWRAILSVTVAVILLALLGFWLAANWRPGSRGQVQTGVVINHPAAQIGLDPAGTPLEINDLRAARVLRAAVQSLALPKVPELDTLASAISIQAVAGDTPAIDNPLVEQAGLMEELGALYQNSAAAPVRFVVRLEVRDALGLSLDEARALLDAVVYQYRLAWAEKYSGYIPLADISVLQGPDEEFDYIQTAALLDGYLQDLNAYVRLHLPDDAYRSATTGLGRPDLLALLDSLEDTGTQVLYTHIFSHTLTKDRAGFVALCGKLADNADLVAAQRHSEALALRSALENTGDGTEADRLMLQFIETGVQAEQKSAEAAFFRNRTEQVRESAATAGPGSAAATRADELAGSIYSQLADLAVLINDTVRDRYLSNLDIDGVTQLFPAGSYSGAQNGSGNIALVLLIALGAGLVLGVLVALFWAYMPARKNRREEAAG